MTGGLCQDGKWLEDGFNCRQSVRLSLRQLVAFSSWLRSSAVWRWVESSPMIREKACSGDAIVATTTRVKRVFWLGARDASSFSCYPVQLSLYYLFAVLCSKKIIFSEPLEMVSSFFFFAVLTFTVVPPKNKFKMTILAMHYVAYVFKQSS